MAPLFRSISCSLGSKTRKSLQRQEQDRLRKAIVALRTKAGLTQRQLSHSLGMTPAYVGKVERGVRLLDVVEFIDLVRMLGGNPVQVMAEILGNERTFDSAVPK